MRQVIAITCIAILAACATPMASYAPVSRVAGDVVYDKNVPITISALQTSRVIVQPPTGAAANERPVFVLLVVNTSDAPITIGPENITATTNERPLEIISSEQLEREARREAFWINFGAGLQAAANSMNAANAGYTTTTGSYGGTVNAYSGGQSAYGTYSGTYVGTQYNAAAANQAQLAANAQNSQIFANAQSQANAVLANSQDGALHRQTIMPGGEYMTPVTIERLPRDAGQVNLRVTIGADVHEFVWNHSRR